MKAKSSRVVFRAAMALPAVALVFVFRCFRLYVVYDSRDYADVQ